MSVSLVEFFDEHKLLLAPMAGVTDITFRGLCIEYGAQLTYSEMVSAKGLSCSNEKTRKLLDLAPGEERIAIQIFGHEPEVMAAEAHAIQEALGERIVYIDINMGCPAKKIVKKGEGSALMKDPHLAAQIVSAVSSRIDIPTTVKFRRGYEIGSETALDFAKRMEDAGAAAVAVHGRYAKQFYRGRADWHIIGAIKQALSIPVIGNGDIEKGEDVCEMYRISACDAFMIGRAARGNPWIFRQAQAALEGKQVPGTPSIDERLELARRHARLLDDQGSHEMVRMRKHAMWYVSGLPGASVARDALNRCSSCADFDRVFNEFQASR